LALTAPSRSRSRDTVAWVAAMPIAASRAATSAWLASDSVRISSAIALRRRLVARVIRGFLAWPPAFSEY
jgi:hypothetical protein